MTTTFDDLENGELFHWVSARGPGRFQMEKIDAAHYRPVTGPNALDMCPAGSMGDSQVMRARPAAPEPKTLRYTVKESGDANFYRVLDGTIGQGGRWFAVVQLNGEIMPATQEAIMQGFVHLLNQHDGDLLSVAPPAAR